MNDQINFTKEELYWIERTADIESSMAMNKFVELCKIDPKKLEKDQIAELLRIGGELIDTHSFLKNLRIKLEINRNEI